jgi:hypothetical protein
MRRLPIPPSIFVADGHSIQPIDPGAEFARLAARVDRLTADRELVDRLMWQNYTGPDWEKFRRALAEYGLAVVHPWIITGRIFIECGRKGFGAIARRRNVTRDEALSLAGETVAMSLRFFRDEVLIPGRWDMEKGASLNTFFIGACVRHFPNVYLRYDGAELTRHLHASQQDAEALSAVGDSSPASRPDRRIDSVRALDAIEDSVVREVFVGEVVGFTQEETAVRLKTTRWAVEGHMRRFRRREG